MRTTAQIDSPCDLFATARSEFDDLIAWVNGDGRLMNHADLEEGLVQRGRHLMRSLLQAHYTQRLQRELRARPHAEQAPTHTARVRFRHLETSVGRVRIGRLAWTWRRKRSGRPSAARPKAPSSSATMPTDRELSLPPQMYSFPLQKRAAEQAARMAFGAASEQLDRFTDGHVPKRQMLQLVARAAQDYEAFYKQLPREAANDTVSTRAVEVMSVDATGVRVRPEALREATRKEAEEQARETIKGDPLASRKARTHDHRMAVVTANWEQERRVRRPEDILRELRRGTSSPPGTRRRGRTKATGRGTLARRIVRQKKLPPPQNKRVSASLEEDSRARIKAMFDEADRRDPERTRDRVALTDGSEAQLDQIREQARARGVWVTIVLDLIHVLHYVWLAAMALHADDKRASAAWVCDITERLMTRPVLDVVAAMRQMATLRKLNGTARETVDHTADFLAKNASCLDYGAYLKAGLPIATGVIEGVCRYLVKDRMDITGARWGLLGGESTLRVRALIVSGHWEQYWEFHLRKEHERNYPSAKEAA